MPVCDLPLPRRCAPSRCALSLALGLLLMISASLATAQTPPTLSAENGHITLSGSELLTNSCWRTSGLHAGAPAGQVVPENAQAVHLALTNTGGNICAMVVTQAPYSLTLSQDESRPFVIFYRSVIGPKDSVTSTILTLPEG